MRKYDTRRLKPETIKEKDHKKEKRRQRTISNNKGRELFHNHPMNPVTLSLSYTQNGR